MRRALRFVVAVSVLAAAAAVSLSVSGCADSAAKRGGPLTGVTWVVDTYSVKGESTTPPADATGEITFQSDKAGGVVLNSYGGPYEVGSNGSLKFGEIVSTMMSGPNDVMEFESSYFKALKATTSYYSDGKNLTLYDGTDNPLVTYSKSTASIVGDWNVISYNNGKSAVVTLVPGSVINAAFDDAGKVAGKSGVNSYSGGYTAGTDGSFVVGELATTRMAGPDDLMKQEAAYLEALQSARTYRLSGNKMTLSTDDGSTAAQLERVGN